MKYTIWSSYVNLEDWEADREDICDCANIDVDDDEAFRNECYFLNDSYLDDERMNLDITVPNGLIVFANGGRWNGRVSGIVDDDVRNIADCLKCWENFWMDVDFGIDDNDDFSIVGHHHDGTDYYTVRKWKSASDREKGIEALEDGVHSNEVFEKYTESVADEIKRVYGWK